MAIELIYPKLSMVWYGNLNQVWAVNLICALIALALGYRIGSKLSAYSFQSRKRILVSMYLLVAVFLGFLMYFSSYLFEFTLTVSELSGALISGVLIMLFTVLPLGITSPLIVSIAEMQNEEGNHISKVFSLSTLGGLLMAVIGGLYLLPLMGNHFMLLISAILMLLNAIVVILIPSENKQ